MWQLRGESSVYPFGSVEVLVEADEVERAREVAGLGPLVAGVDRAAWPTRADPAPEPARTLGPRLWLWLAVLAVVAGASPCGSVHVG